jgi:hypothetical protein
LIDKIIAAAGIISFKALVQSVINYRFARKKAKKPPIEETKKFNACDKREKVQVLKRRKKVKRFVFK